MIDHVSFAVHDFSQSLAFYDKTLACLSYERLMLFDDEEHAVAGYGRNEKPAFWIGAKKNLSEEDKKEQIGKAAGLHVAFVAPTLDAVHKWYETCLELGGKDNGLPGPRPEYHPGYYGAFVIDPDGWRIEACLHHYVPQA